MARFITVGAAQMGPVGPNESRAAVVVRLLEMLREAKGRGCDLVVFTECALTPFFPRGWEEDPNACDQWFEREMPGSATAMLFNEAKKLGIGFHLGFAELAEENGRFLHFNSSVLVGPDGQIIGKYRKIHLPGLETKDGDNPHRSYEKRYFDAGNLGFRAWRAFGGTIGLCLGNDRRWPETYRVLGLQGAEMILLGYNTASDHPDHPELDHLTNFHSMLSMQAGAYQNGCFVIGVAKAGTENGINQIGRSAIIAPSGEVVTQCTTLEDELVVHRCNLDQTAFYKNQIFNLAARRQIEAYSLMTETRGPIPPFEPGQDLDGSANSAASKKSADEPIQKLFTEQYGYSPEAAEELAKRAKLACDLKEPLSSETSREPLQKQSARREKSADPLEAIGEVLSEVYQYSPAQIETITLQAARALELKTSQENEAGPVEVKTDKPKSASTAKEPLTTHFSKPPIEKTSPALSSEEAFHVFSVLTEKYGFAPKTARGVAERANAAFQRWQKAAAENAVTVVPPVKEPPPTVAAPQLAAGEAPAEVASAVLQQAPAATPAPTAEPVEDPIVAIPCPQCSFQLKIHQSNLSLLGRKARCPQCQTKFRLPESV